MFKKNKILSSFTSTIILFFLFIMLFIVIINQMFIQEELKKYTQLDTVLINKFGQIRGGIQRYTKLKIIYNNRYLKVNKEINNYFSTINSYLTSNTNIIPHENIIKFYDLYNDIQILWEQIQKTDNKYQLIFLSEKAWDKSNKLTCLVTQIAKNKIEKFKNIILIFSILTISVIFLIIIIVYFLVRTGLEKSTITDPLTKLYNRLFFNTQILYLKNRYYRTKQPFSAMLFDIDNFKKINDTYGHHIGDEVLKNIAKIIKNSIRKTDIACRYGGEEFIILFPDTNKQKALEISERIRKEIEKNVIYDDKPVTISAGVGEFNDSYKTIHHFIHDIDEALYTAKRTGKNKIIPV